MNECALMVVPWHLKVTSASSMSTRSSAILANKVEPEESILEDDWVCSHFRYYLLAIRKIFHFHEQIQANNYDYLNVHLNNETKRF